MTTAVQVGFGIELLHADDLFAGAVDQKLVTDTADGVVRSWFGLVVGPENAARDNNELSTGEAGQVLLEDSPHCLGIREQFKSVHEFSSSGSRAPRSLTCAASATSASIRSKWPSSKRVTQPATRWIIKYVATNQFRFCGAILQGAFCL